MEIWKVVVWTVDRGMGGLDADWIGDGDWMMMMMRVLII